MERLNYDVVALGELELRRWPLTDSLLTAGSTLPIVTTNIELRDTTAVKRGNGDAWRPLGARYRIVDVGGARVAFISVLPEGRTSAHALEQTKGRVRLLPGLGTTREAASLLKGTAQPKSFGNRSVLSRAEAERMARERADIVVLLGYLDKEGTQAYADSVPEIDVILGGVHQVRDEQPVLLGHAVVNRSGDRGVAVAVTDLVVSPLNEIVEFSGRTVVLEESLPEDPDVAALAAAANEATEREGVARRELKRKLREQQRLEREARRLQEDEPQRPPSTGAPRDSLPPATGRGLPTPQVRGRAH